MIPAISLASTNGAIITTTTTSTSADTLSPTTVVNTLSVTTTNRKRKGTKKKIMNDNISHQQQTIEISNVMKVEERKKVEDHRDDYDDNKIATDHNDDVNTGTKRSLLLDQYRYVDHCQQSIKISTTTISSSSSKAAATARSRKCSLIPQIESEVMRNTYCNGNIAPVTIRRSSRIKLIS